MDTIRNKRICPVEHAGALDLNIRKLVQNPKKILKPYINTGMTVLDLGCGPGFFTIEIAKLVGNTGKVIAADVQEGMLEKVKAKIQNTALSDIIRLHKSQSDKIGLQEKVDFILVFYMLHEVPDQSGFLKEINTLLKPQGSVLIAEPKFHVSNNDFIKSMNIMEQSGFEIVEQPKIFFSKACIIKNAKNTNKGKQ